MLFGSTFKSGGTEESDTDTSLHPRCLLTSDFLSHLADVDAGLILVVGPVANGQAQLVLDVGSVQVHLLFRGRRTLSASRQSAIETLTG